MAYRVASARDLILVGALAIAGAAAAVIYDAKFPSNPDAVVESWRRSAPRFAPVMSNDASRNGCIVETGTRLRATREDFVKGAVDVCNAAHSLTGRY